jgi:hypothetical protein
MSRRAASRGEPVGGFFGGARRRDCRHGLTAVRLRNRTTSLPTDSDGSLSAQPAVHFSPEPVEFFSAEPGFSRGARPPTSRGRGRPAVAGEIEGASLPEFDPLPLQEGPLEAGRDVWHPIGGASSGSVHHAMPRNASRASVHRPPHRPRREPAAEQGGDLAVAHDPAFRDSPDKRVHTSPRARPVSLDLPVDTALGAESPANVASPHE